MIEEDMARAILQELQNIANDGQKFAHTLIAFTENTITKGEFIELCAEIFNEAGNLERSSRSFLRLIIAHLLLLKYGVDITAHRHISNEIEAFQKNLDEDLNWGLKTQETTVINKLRELMPLIYLRGIRTYRDHDKENPNLKTITRSLPEQCPWTLEELVEGSINVLLLKLPTI